MFLLPLMFNKSKIRKINLLIQGLSVCIKAIKLCYLFFETVRTLFYAYYQYVLLSEYFCT
jgi:hypothetical protein